MAYSIDPSADVADEVRWIARSQVAAAVMSLTDPGDDIAAAVHDGRKRCKKVRGLLRLVRPALGDAYGPSNAAFRDAARELSPLRDAQALLVTFDELAGSHDPVEPGDLSAVRAELARRAAMATERADAGGPRIASAIELLGEAEMSIDRWEIDDADIDTFAGGARRSYRRGRRALAAAVGSPTPENFHEYRKRSKYSWYHVRLLRKVAPSVMVPLARSFHELSDLLGDDHDLAVLAAQLQDEPDRFGGRSTVGEALVVIEGRRAELQRRAVRLGSRLHAETPSAFRRRLHAYWEAWHEHGPEDGV